MTRLYRAAGLIAATLLVAGCSLFADKDEELEPKELVAIKESVKVRKVWSAKVGGGSEALRLALRPTGDGNRIYAASHDGKVSAFDAETGKLAWRTELDVEITAGPGAGEGYVAVMSREGYAILLDASNGDER